MKATGLPIPLLNLLSAMQVQTTTSSMPHPRENHDFADRSEYSPESPRAQSLSSDDSLAQFRAVEFDDPELGQQIDTQVIDCPKRPFHEADKHAEAVPPCTSSSCTGEVFPATSPSP